MQADQTFNKVDLKRIYDEHFDGLRRFLYYKCGEMELAEDLVQEVFIKVWEKRAIIRKESVKSLLFTIANNLLMNHFNHMKVVRSHEGQEIQMGTGHAVSPQFVLEEKEFEEELNRVIGELPDGCREVFLMNRIDKLKYEEIAERLELSVKAIEKRMSKALSILKEELGRKL